jgi:hypothetical protein
VTRTGQGEGLSGCHLSGRDVRHAGYNDRWVVAARQTRGRCWSGRTDVKRWHRPVDGGDQRVTHGAALLGRTGPEIHGGDQSEPVARARKKGNGA